MATSNLTAQKREDLSNSATTALRNKGNVPGYFIVRIPALFQFQ
jgi:hypothetical protein